MHQADIQARQLSRRLFLVGAATSCALAPKAAGQETASAPKPDEQCIHCGGLELLPVKDARPFVWLEGTALPGREAAVGEQYCPLCQPAGDSGKLAREAKERLDGARDMHAQWEERTGWKLVLAVTRHATIHTLLTPTQARSAAMAIENLTLHLKRVTKSLALTPTRPHTYELVILWEKPSWDQFRKVMEGLYTAEQLGDSWAPAREFNSYDHYVTPHMYETPQSIRTRPPTHGTVFLAARRQINVATAWHAPLWLAEGFAEYGDYAVHKANRWFSIYDVSRAPPAGDWMVEARRLAADDRLRPWEEMMKQELRDWESADYVQTMVMVAFLLETEPRRFLDFTQRLSKGEQDIAALERAYSAESDELDQRCTRWLLARR
jgi:hypothetical protein